MECNRNIKTFLIIAGCLAVMSALLSGCDHKTDRKMEEIEAVLDNALDSATILPAIRSLDSIPVETLNKRQRALHALLTVQSRHKQHLPLATDSLAFYEAAYFDGSSDTRHRMKWHFYRGATRLQLEDYRGAIFDALHAIRLSTSLPDTLFMAKSEELLADIYDATFNVTLAIKHRRYAASYYEAANKKSNSLYVYRDLVRELVFLSKYDDCVSILDSLTKQIAPNDSDLLSSIYSYYADVYSATGKYQDVDCALTKSRLYCGDNYINDSDLAFVGRVFQRTNRPDSVEYYIELCNKDPYYINNVVHLGNQEWLAKQEGDYLKACLLSDSIQKLHNLIVRKNLATQESIAQADYYVEIANAEEKQSRKMSVIAIIVIISSIAIISAGTIVYVRRKRSYEVELSEKFCKMAQCKKEIASLETQIDSFKHSNHSNTLLITKLKDILQSEYSRLDSQINEYSSSFDPNTRSKAKVSNIHTPELNGKINAENLLNNVVDFINLSYDNLISKLTTQVTILKPSDIQFIALKLAGFSSQSICLIMGISSTAYYTRWHRLRAKISQCDAPDRDCFLNIINNA